jgi:hypothetical protein
VRAVEIVIPWPPSVPSVNAVIAAPVPRLLGYPGSFALAARPVPRHVSGAVHVPSQVVVVRHCQRFRTCRVSCPPKESVDRCGFDRRAVSPPGRHSLIELRAEPRTHAIPALQRPVAHDKVVVVSSATMAKTALVRRATPAL